MSCSECSRTVSDDDQLMTFECPFSHRLCTECLAKNCEKLSCPVACCQKELEKDVSQEVKGDFSSANNCQTHRQNIFGICASDKCVSGSRAACANSDCHKNCAGKIVKAGDFWKSGFGASERLLSQVNWLASRLCTMGYEMLNQKSIEAFIVSEAKLAARDSGQLLDPETPFREGKVTTPALAELESLLTATAATNSVEQIVNSFDEWSSLGSGRPKLSFDFRANTSAEIIAKDTPLGKDDGKATNLDSDDENSHSNPSAQEATKIVSINNNDDFPEKNVKKSKHNHEKIEPFEDPSEDFVNPNILYSSEEEDNPQSQNHQKQTSEDHVLLDSSKFKETVLNTGILYSSEEEDNGEVPKKSKKKPLKKGPNDSSETSSKHSKILNNQNLAKLLSLIPGIKRMTLLYSNDCEDRNYADEFHEKCDAAKETIVLGKFKDYIAGGYSDQTWKGDDIKNSYKSFLFSLNREKIYKVKDTEIAVYCHPWYGPRFGRKIKRS